MQGKYKFFDVHFFLSSAVSNLVAPVKRRGIFQGRIYGFKCNKKFSGMLMVRNGMNGGENVDEYLIDASITSLIEGLADECTRIERA